MLTQTQTFKEQYAKFFLGVLQSMLDHKAANVGTVLNSMSKCKATASVLTQAYKWIVTIRETTKTENHQYLGKPFFYNLNAGEPQGEGSGYCVRLDTKGKVLSIKLALDPARFDSLLKVQTWLSNSFRQCYHFLMSRYEPADDSCAQDDLIDDVRAKITLALEEVKPERANRKRNKREDDESEIDDACSLVSIHQPPAKIKRQ